MISLLLGLERALYFLILDRVPSRAWWLATAALLTLAIWGGTFRYVAAGGMAPRDWIWDLLNCVGVLALWGIGLRRRLVSRMFWRCFLFIYVTTHVIEFFMPDPRLRDYPPALIALVFVAVYTPYYLG